MVSQLVCSLSMRCDPWNNPPFSQQNRESVEGRLGGFPQSQQPLDDIHVRVWHHEASQCLLLICVSVMKEGRGYDDSIWCHDHSHYGDVCECVRADTGFKAKTVLET